VLQELLQPATLFYAPALPSYIHLLACVQVCQRCSGHPGSVAAVLIIGDV
jgi:hypothetical protein